MTYATQRPSCVFHAPSRVACVVAVVAALIATAAAFAEQPLAAPEMEGSEAAAEGALGPIDDLQFTGAAPALQLKEAIERIGNDLLFKGEAFSCTFFMRGASPTSPAKPESKEPPELITLGFRIAKFHGSALVALEKTGQLPHVWYHPIGILEVHPADGKLDAITPTWDFRIESGLRSPVNVEVPLEDPACHAVVVRPQDVLKGLAGTVGNSSSWDRPTRTLELRGEVGRRLLVRFRTPEDAEQFGSRLGCLRGWNDAGSVFELSGASVTDSPFSQLAHRTEEEFIREVMELREQPSREDGTVRRRFWQAFTHSPGPDWDPDDAVLVKLLGYTAQAVAPAPETLSEPESTGYVASCCVHIESYLDDSMRLNADGALLPDDPHLTWLRGEYLTAPDHWRTIFDRCRVLLRLPKTNLTARVYLASVLGSLGTPPGEPIFEATPGMPDADYVEAVIRSAWSQPCEERHARACHERRERDPECRRDGGFAVDALVRMGRTGEVPAAQLDRWLEQRVNRVEAPRRWRNLCWMSRDARLRQTLREKLATVGFVREAADDVKAILDARRLSDLEEEQREAP